METLQIIFLVLCFVFAVAAGVTGVFLDRNRLTLALSFLGLGSFALAVLFSYLKLLS